MQEEEVPIDKEARAFESKVGKLEEETTPRPQENEPQSEYGQGPYYKPPPPGLRPRQILLILIAALAIIVIAGAFVFGGRQTQVNNSTITTTSSTSTIPIYKFNITSCTDIVRPGIYYLKKNLNTSVIDGACISIMSRDVILVGNGNSIKGKGPYSAVPPFSYGIRIENASNVTVGHVSIDNFSFGIFADNMSNSELYSINSTKNILAGIYLNNSNNNKINDSRVLSTQSDMGGIYLLGGGSNIFENDTSTGNQHYGIVINSTGNSFQNDKFTSNPVDLLCNISSSRPNQDSFTASDCNVNKYCGFASCARTNTPLDLTSITLPSGKVNSCGRISSSGDYALANSLDVSTFLNRSNPSTGAEPCIDVTALNAKLDCMGKSITNAGYAIEIQSSLNTSVSNCTLINDTTAIQVDDSLSTRLGDMKINDYEYGIVLHNATSGEVYNTITQYGEYGLLMNSTVSFVISGLHSTDNRYGVDFDKGSENLFNGGYIKNNTKVDMFCSTDTYNSTTDIFQGISECGVTDCTWATPCDNYILPPLAFYPLSGCATIKTGGNYSVNSSVIAFGTCFRIASNNVTIDCHGNSISGYGSGSAFSIANVYNVSISNCNASNFALGVNVNNSRQVYLTSLEISRMQIPMVLKQRLPRAA